MSLLGRDALHIVTIRSMAGVLLAHRLAFVDVLRFLIAFGHSVSTSADHAGILA